MSASRKSIQKVRGRVAIDALGIESNGLKLKRLRRLGNGLFGGDAQCVVHVGILSLLFCLSSIAYIRK